VPVLIGAHVSPAGGPAKAVARGIERGAQAIQIFNQNPRAWKPRDYSDEEVAAFRTAMAGCDVDALLIHAVYLLNCASDDETIRANTLRSLVASLEAGALLGAHAVVLHPGSAKTGDVGAAIARAGEVIGEGELGEDGCAVFLSEPRFDGLPIVLETPGPNHTGPTAAELTKTRALRARGLAARGMT
jgi:deoxyribonuclease-4